MRTADFTIVSKPSYISFECPYCKENIEIDWENIDDPESWSDPWGYVECPECKKMIELGNWDYD